VTTLLARVRQTGVNRGDALPATVARPRPEVRVAPARPPTPFEAMLSEDLEALVFLRVPQLPSSRVWGDYPVVNAWEYRKRYPSDPAKAQTVPVPSRPFPDHLRDADLLPPPGYRGQVALAVWAILSVVGIPWILWRWWRRPQRGSANVAVQ